jgi:hypothetical protein
MRWASAGAKVRRMRTTSLLLGGIAGFLGLIEATFFWLVDAIIGGGDSPFVTAGFSLLGLVGAALAKHRPRACAALESTAGVGLLAGGHLILGCPLLAAAVLCLASLKTSPLPDRTESPVRADAASALTVLGMAGLAIVAGLALPILGLLLLGLALSGGSADGGVVHTLTLAVTIPIVLGFALLGLRAWRRS